MDRPAAGSPGPWATGSSLMIAESSQVSLDYDLNTAVSLQAPVEEGATPLAGRLPQLQSGDP